MIPFFDISKISRNLNDVSHNLVQLKILAERIQPRIISSIQTKKQVDPFANLSEREKKKLKRSGSIWKVSVASPGGGIGSDWKPLDESLYSMIGFDEYTKLGNSNYFIPLPKETISSIVNAFLATDTLKFSDFTEKNFGVDVSAIFLPDFALHYTQQGDDFIIDNDDRDDRFDPAFHDDNELDSDYSLYFTFVQDVP